MKSKVMLGILVVSLTGSVFGANETKIETDQQKFSYAIGYQIAESVKRQGFDVDVDMLIQAIRDDLTGKPLRISVDEMRAAVETYQQKLLQELAEKNQQVGEAFLAANKQKVGVVALASGLQYKVMQEGKGAKPTLTDTVVVHYRGHLVTGEEFDSSYARGEPATFPLNGVIQGWQEVLQLMPEGAKWQVFIPPALAYGTSGAGNRIGPNQTLVFEIELVEIKK